MDDIYTFGQKPYIPADPLQRSVLRSGKNVLLFLLTSVKCSVFGIFILLKSIVFLFIPLPTKDIQNQVALVNQWKSTLKHRNQITIFFIFLQITGGANGIGRCIGIELAKCGCNIALAGIFDSQFSSFNG